MLINTINQKHTVEFAKGKFDNWCVYLIRNGVNRYAPIDEEYFSYFKLLASKHSAEKVYNDFVKVYNPTTSIYNPEIIKLIKQISTFYNNDAEEVEIWFSVIYGGMVAEENKQNMILKKE